MIGNNDNGDENTAHTNNDNGTSSHTHGGTGDDREPTIQELMARIRHLEETRQSRVVQQIVTSKKMRKPPGFKGDPEDRDNRTIHVFLDTMDNYLEIDTVQATERSKIHDLVSFLEDGAAREYHHRVKDHGPFITYNAVKEWLIEHYSPSDPVNTVRDHFFACRQKEGESFEDYHYRFKEAKNLLDSPLSDTYIVYFFVKQLLRGYRQQIQGDPEFAKYDKVTTDDVVSKLKRVNRGIPYQLLLQQQAAQSNNPNKRFNSDHDSNNAAKKRRIGSQYESNKGPSTSQPNNNAPLTDGQKSFLENNIRNGGGRLLFEVVQNNTDWKRRAYSEGRCYKCAATDHLANQCKAKATPRNTGTGGNLNAIVPNDEFDEFDHLNDPSRL
jgi:hypothetical protein